MNIGQFVTFAGSMQRKRIEHGKTAAKATPGCIGKIVAVRHGKNTWYTVEWGYPGFGELSAKETELLPSAATELPEKPRRRTREKVETVEDAGETDEKSETSGDNPGEDNEDKMAE